MNFPLFRLAAVAAPGALIACTLFAQSSSPDAGSRTPTLSVQAELVTVPAVVYDKKGLVTTLTKDSFAISVDGKPQTVRYFDHETAVPLTVGLLVDTSRSVSGGVAEEQKASQAFLESLLSTGSANRPADKAFVLQFGRTAELLQDVTASRPLLEAGLKEVGTEAPGAGDAEEGPADNPQPGSGSGNGNGNGSGNNGGYGNPNGYPGYGRGGQGRNNPAGASTGEEHRRRGGTVLYDALYLASREVLARQTGRRAVILLTDGEDRHSKESLTEAIEAAQRADTVVYAIYLRGEDRYDNRGNRGGFGYPGGYPGEYPGGGYPGSGGRPGSDGTYAPVDGKKILQRICGETGGQVFEAKGKGSLDTIYGQIGDELRAGYRLGFTPAGDAASPGYHKIELTLTDPEGKKMELQTREGYYMGKDAAH